jgi:hypothetical protein
VFSCYREVSKHSYRTMNVTQFSEQYYTGCGATIGPDEPTSYNGLYVKDDHFPAKVGNRTM